MARDYVLQGGDGVISVTANVAPATMSKMMAAANADDAKAASMLDAPLAALHRDLFCEARIEGSKDSLSRKIERETTRCPCSDSGGGNHRGGVTARRAPRRDLVSARRCASEPTKILV